MTINAPASTSKPLVPSQDYYGGLDLGQKKDYSVVTVVLKKDSHYYLKHMNRFPLRTEYVKVLAYLKQASEEFHSIRRWSIDQTGVGEAFPELARKIGLTNVQGVELSLPRKQEIMTNMKQVMEQKRLHIPLDRDLISEIHGVIAELTATGKTKFSHRSGTHDDRLWALALALYGGRHDIETYHPVAAVGRTMIPWGFGLPPLVARRLFGKKCGYSSGFPYPWPPSRSRVGC